MLLKQTDSLFLGALRNSFSLFAFAYLSPYDTDTGKMRSNDARL